MKVGDFVDYCGSSNRSVPGQGKVVAIKENGAIRIKNAATGTFHELHPDFVRVVSKKFRPSGK